MPKYYVWFIIICINSDNVYQNIKWTLLAIFEKKINLQLNSPGLFWLHDFQVSWYLKKCFQASEVNLRLFKIFSLPLWHWNSAVFLLFLYVQFPDFIYFCAHTWVADSFPHFFFFIINFIMPIFMEKFELIFNFLSSLLVPKIMIMASHMRACVLDFFLVKYICWNRRKTRTNEIVSLMLEFLHTSAECYFSRETV